MIASSRPRPAERHASAPRPSLRMRPDVRKAVLVLHLLSAGAWIGVDVVLGVLVFTGLGTSDAGLAALCLGALPLLIWPLLATGTVSLATGVLLGLGTKWGLLRFWWVAVKLALNIVLVVLVGVLLAPAAGSAAAVHAAGGDLGSLAFPPIVSGTALVVATVLAVYKPWGRIGAARRPR